LAFHTAELAALDLKESFVAAANAGNKQKYVREFRGGYGHRGPSRLLRGLRIGCLSL